MKTVRNITTQKFRTSRYLNLVETIYAADNVPTKYSGSTKSMLQEFFSKTSKRKNTFKREVFKRLLLHAYNQKCFALLRSYGHVGVLHNMCSFGNRMVRTIETWNNEEVMPEHQLRSLIRHCFAKYDTPVFLENAFFEAAKTQMLWYVQMGNGRSVKTLSQLPVKLTHRMAHEFRLAPKHFMPLEALRYAQAIGFGATTNVAKMLAMSSLARGCGDNEGFWSGVVQFFANEETLDATQMHIIITYLEHVLVENPTYSLKGRTFKALLRQSQEWHRKSYINSNGGVLQWNPSEIQPLYKEEWEGNKKVVYRTVELLNSWELYDEGNEMHHCVAEYDENCNNGECAIFSLKRETEDELPKHLATIEVLLPSKNLGEFKSKYNESPSPKTLELINHWILNSEVNRNSEMVYNVEQHEFRNHGNVNNRTNEDWVYVMKIILWVLYLLWKFSRLSN